jgi:putative endonuclease
MRKVTQYCWTPWGTWRGSEKGCYIDDLRPDDRCVVYVLDCGEAGNYVGHTNNFERRLKQHRTGRGSIFTRKHGVYEVKWVSRPYPRVEAAKLELWLQHMAGPVIDTNRRITLPYVPLAEQPEVVLDNVATCDGTTH